MYYAYLCTVYSYVRILVRILLSFTQHLRSTCSSTGDSECGRGRGRGRGQWRGRGRGQWRGNGRESGGDGGGRDRGRGRGRGRGGNSWRDGDEADADGARDTQEALVARSSAHGPRIAHAPPAAPPLPSPSVALTDPFALAAPRPARKRRTSELSEGGSFVRPF